MTTMLVGLDGSESERLVLDRAVALAEKVGARLLLFRAVGLPAELPRRALAIAPDSVGELLESDARRHLDELAARVPPGLVGKTRVDIGQPWRAICDAARAEKADLIVIGSHGYGGMDRLLGTTAAKVVNHAESSVLVVRAA